MKCTVLTLNLAGQIGVQDYSRLLLDLRNKSLVNMQHVLVEMSLVEADFFDPNTGQLLQVNGLFARA